MYVNTTGWKSTARSEAADFAATLKLRTSQYDGRSQSVRIPKDTFYVPIPPEVTSSLHDIFLQVTLFEMKLAPRWRIVVHPRIKCLNNVTLEGKKKNEREKNKTDKVRFFLFCVCFFQPCHLAERCFSANSSDRLCAPRYLRLAFLTLSYWASRPRRLQRDIIFRHDSLKTTKSRLFVADRPCHKNFELSEFVLIMLQKETLRSPSRIPRTPRQL